jgi:hypothetical protein
MSKERKAQMPNHLTLKAIHIELDEQRNMIVWRDGKSVEVPRILTWLIREHYPQLGKYRELLADAAELLEEAENLDSEKVKHWQDRYQALIHGSS